MVALLRVRINVPPWSCGAASSVPPLLRRFSAMECLRSYPPSCGFVAWEILIFLFTQLWGSRCVVADSRVQGRRWILSLEGSVEVRSIHSYQRTLGLILGSFTRSGSDPQLLSGCGGYVCFCDSAVWLSPLGLLASTNPPCTFSPLGLLGIVREAEDLMTAKLDF